MASGGFVIDTCSANTSPVAVASLYKRSEIHLVRQWLRRDLDVIGLRSSLGLVSLNIARLRARDRGLVCVEANLNLIDTLVSGFLLNAPWKHVEIVNRAIGCSGQPEIDLGSAKSGRGGDQLVRVGTAPLRRGQYRISQYALVSDIEGAEAEILEEDGEALARCRQLVAELHPTSYRGRPSRVEA